MIDIFDIVFHPFMMLVYGLVMHFCRKVLAAATHGAEKIPTLSEYWRDKRLQSLLSVMGAITGYALIAHFPDFDKMAPEIQNIVRANAFTIGYMADNIVDAVGEKAMNRIKGNHPNG